MKKPQSQLLNRETNDKNPPSGIRCQKKRKNYKNPRPIDREKRKTKS